MQSLVQCGQPRAEKSESAAVRYDGIFSNHENIFDFAGVACGATATPTSLYSLAHHITRFVRAYHAALVTARKRKVSIGKIQI